MKNIFHPNRQKLFTTCMILGVAIASLSFRAIPVQIDILDLREVPEFVVFVFGRIPIEIFDFITNEAFASRGEGFLVFPTLPQIGFALLFDIAAVYLASCLICHFWRRFKKRPS
jgi:hypothetical protein